MEIVFIVLFSLIIGAEVREVADEADVPKVEIVKKDTSNLDKTTDNDYNG